MIKTLGENFAVMMVVLLFGIVIALVVHYNMIEETGTVAFTAIPEEKPAKAKKQTKAYLQSLESYGEDIDVKVDPTKETQKNTVKVTSELIKDDLEKALKTDETKNYLKSLENYSDGKKSKIKTERLEDIKPEKVQNDDTIGDELEDIVGE